MYVLWDWDLIFEIYVVFNVFPSSLFNLACHKGSILSVQEVGKSFLKKLLYPINFLLTSCKVLFVAASLSVNKI